MTLFYGESGTLLFDESHDPLIFAAFSGETAGEPTAAYLRNIDALLKRGKPFGVIIDLAKARSTDKKSWSEVAGFLRERRMPMEKLTIGTALIVRNSLMRAAVSGVFWLEPIRGPYAICMGNDAAMAWMRDRFKERGFAFPALAEPPAAPPLPATPAVNPAR